MIEHLQAVYVPTIQLIWPALIGAGAVLFAGAMVGTFILLRRESLLALAVPQAVVLGSAIALRTGIPPVFASAASVGVLLACLGPVRRRETATMLLPAVYVGAMALAVMLVAGGARDLVEIQNQFVGIDIAVDEATAVCASVLLLSCGAAAAGLWRRWLVVSQLPETAALARARPALWHLLLLLLLAVVAIVGTGVSGMVITIAALFVPSTMGLLLGHRLPTALAISAVASLGMLAGGLVVSVEFEAPLGYSIAATGFTVLLVVLPLSMLRRPTLSRRNTKPANTP